MSFPRGLAVKNPPVNAGDMGLIPGSGRSPGWGHGNPLQYSCLENPHGRRSLAGYSPWGHRELDTTEQLNSNDNNFNQWNWKHVWVSGPGYKPFAYCGNNNNNYHYHYLVSMYINILKYNLKGYFPFTVIAKHWLYFPVLYSTSLSLKWKNRRVSCSVVSNSLWPHGL